MKFAHYMLMMLSFFFCVTPASAQIKIDVSQGVSEPLPFVAPAFLGTTETERRIGRDLTDLITRNLANSGLFRPLNPQSFLQTITSVDTEPRFADWRVIRADVLLVGGVRLLESDKLEVKYRLWDVYTGQELFALSLETSVRNWRRLGHKISDTIYERLTGEKGYFNTRIAFIAESGPKGNRQKRLTIMDQDGANMQFLTPGRDLVLTPRFSPSKDQILYLSYENDRPQVFLYDLPTGRHMLLGDFSGMTFAPRFSPDGSKVIMSLVKNGNSDIYLFDINTKRQTRLTRHPGIDTSPSFSPDGRFVVFSSDRGGTAQLYVMNAKDGGDVRRISFGEGRYHMPVWSPRGDLIAFTKQNKGRFSIGVLKPEPRNQQERILAEDYLVESPAWSPNGLMVLYTRQGPQTRGRSEIWRVSLAGGQESKLPLQGEASDPGWSPLIRE